MGCSSNSSIKTTDDKNPTKKQLVDNSKLSVSNKDIKKENSKDNNSIIVNSENSEEELDNFDNEFNQSKNLKIKNINVFNEEDNKIILPPATKEFIVEGNDTVVNKKYKKRTYQGVTILENIKDCIPETMERDEVKDIVYHALGSKIVKDETQYIKGKNLTVQQVEGIIDIIFKIVHENENTEKNEIEDERLKDVKVNINFYDATEENIRKYIFNGQNPTDEEVENTLKQFNSEEEGTKILRVDILD